jgi:hypothetical protein
MKTRLIVALAVGGALGLYVACGGADAPNPEPQTTHTTDSVPRAPSPQIPVAAPLPQAPTDPNLPPATEIAACNAGSPFGSTASGSTAACPGDCGDGSDAACKGKSGGSQCTDSGGLPSTCVGPPSCTCQKQQ